MEQTEDVLILVIMDNVRIPGEKVAAFDFDNVLILVIMDNVRILIGSNFDRSMDNARS